MTYDVQGLTEQAKSAIIGGFRELTLNAALDGLRRHFHGPITEDMLKVDPEARAMILNALRRTMKEYYGTSAPALACQQLINELSDEQN